LSLERGSFGGVLFEINMRRVAATLLLMAALGSHQILAATVKVSPVWGGLKVTRPVFELYMPSSFQRGMITTERHA
jgi:hypothetical protein